VLNARSPNREENLYISEKIFPFVRSSGLSWKYRVWCRRSRPHAEEVCIIDFSRIATVIEAHLANQSNDWPAIAR